MERNLMKILREQLTQLRDNAPNRIPSRSICIWTFKAKPPATGIEFPTLQLTDEALPRINDWPVSKLEALQTSIVEKRVLVEMRDDFESVAEDKVDDETSNSNQKRRKPYMDTRGLLRDTIESAIGRPLKILSDHYNFLVGDTIPPNLYQWKFSTEYPSFPGKGISTWTSEELEECETALSDGHLTVIALPDPRAAKQQIDVLPSIELPAEDDGQETGELSGMLVELKTRFERLVDIKVKIKVRDIQQKWEEEREEFARSLEKVGQESYEAGRKSALKSMDDSDQTLQEVLRLVREKNLAKVEQLEKGHAAQLEGFRREYEIRIHEQRLEHNRQLSLLRHEMTEEQASRQKMTMQKEDFPQGMPSRSHSATTASSDIRMPDERRADSAREPQRVTENNKNFFPVFDSPYKRAIDARDRNQSFMFQDQNAHNQTDEVPDLSPSDGAADFHVPMSRKRNRSPEDRRQKKKSRSIHYDRDIYSVDISSDEDSIPARTTFIDSWAPDPPKRDRAAEARNNILRCWRSPEAQSWVLREEHTANLLSAVRSLVGKLDSFEETVRYINCAIISRLENSRNVASRRPQPTTKDFEDVTADKIKLFEIKSEMLEKYHLRRGPQGFLESDGTGSSGQPAFKKARHEELDSSYTPDHDDTYSQSQ